MLSGEMRDLTDLECEMVSGGVPWGAMMAAAAAAIAISDAAGEFWDGFVQGMKAEKAH